VDTKHSVSLDDLGWRSFLFSFLALITGPFLWFTLVPLLLAFIAARYAHRARGLSKASNERMNWWGRIGSVLSALLIVWMVIGTIYEFV
jgi:hypothetical protein